MNLSGKQRAVLSVLAEYVKPPSIRQLADRLERPTFRSAAFSYSEVYNAVTSLERKGAVRRVGQRPICWEPTEAGREQLDKEG